MHFHVDVVDDAFVHEFASDSWIEIFIIDDEDGNIVNVIFRFFS